MYILVEIAFKDLNQDIQKQNKKYNGMCHTITSIMCDEHGLYLFNSSQDAFALIDKVSYSKES